MKFPIPFHPIVVHFPIAFYCLELVLLLFWISKKDENYLRFALFSFRLGYLLMIAAMVAGFIDVRGLAHIKGRVRTHFFAALSVFILYTVRAFFWRFGNMEDRNYRLTHVLFAATGNVLVALTGYFGGLLVYG